MKALTIAIPCYNVEHLVGHCMDSILSAGVNDQIEVLAINDGSQDATSRILHGYAQRHPNTVRVIDKANGGWGTAVNLAIREAKGKYFKEVDADDWVMTENLRQYVSILNELDVDYVANSFIECHLMDKADDVASGRHQLHNVDANLCNTIHNACDFWEHHPSSWAFPIHCITYNTRFLRLIDLRVGDRYYADIEYFLKSMPFVRTLFMMNVPITVYARGYEEQSTGMMGYAKHYRDMANLSLRLISFYESLSATTNPRIIPSIVNTINGTIALSYELMLSPTYAANQEGSLSFLKKYDSQIQQHPFFYETSSNVRKRGIRYIKFWRNTSINLLRINKLKITLTH
ncbi:MAG: glycosyltransferase family 2 protein [Bacteroidales bacterium]|nr:glycosyltransferase family 2 protein [Bacteroidales bacterium]